MFPSDALVIARARHGKTTAYLFRLCLLLTATHLTGVSIPMALAQAEDSGAVSLALMKPSGQVYSRVEPSLQLTTTKATKQPGDHLATLLRRRGFHFDGSSASLFYRANPSVTDFANLPASAEVNAPDIEKTPAVQRALKSGFVVYVTTDKELKENVMSAINQLIASEPIVDQLDAQVFAS